MAPKQQDKKKTKEVKKKKAQKKPQPVRGKQKKSQPQKGKKRKPQLKRQAKQRKAGSAKQEPKICSPRLFASKILKLMPKVRMEAKARKLVKTMLTDMYSHVTAQVEASLSQKNEPSAISATDVQTALREAMTKELVKHTACEEPPSAPNECA